MILSESEAIVKIQQQLNTVYLALIWSVFAIWQAKNKGMFNSFIPSKNTPIKGIAVFLGFSIYIFAQVFIIPQLIAIIYHLINGSGINFNALSPSMQFWFNIIIMAGAYISLLFFYVYFFSDEQKKSIFGDNTNKKWYQHYFFGASTWFLIFPLILLWSQLIDIFILFKFHRSPLEQLPVEQFKIALTHPFWMVIMGIMIFGVVPIVEEFLFRGLLQPWFKKKLNSPTLGIIFASIIFSVFHFSSSQDISNIQFLSSIFLLSCFLGFLYEREKSLWASIGLHSIFNAVSVILVILEK
jgi:hypothetical protein